MNFNREQLMRYLELVMKKFYVRFDFVRATDSLDNLIKDAYDRYLDSGMSVDEINKDISTRIEALRDKHEKKPREEAICAIVDKECAGHEDLFAASLDDLKKLYLTWYLDSDKPLEEIEKEIHERVRNRIETEKNNIEDDDKQEIFVDDEVDQMIDERLVDFKGDGEVSKKDSKGFISLFSISLSLLVVSAFILFAMILNVLLK